MKSRHSLRTVPTSRSQNAVALVARGDHHRFLVNVHADILDVATHSVASLGERSFASTESFPQGKVPFSTPVAYPFLGSFRAQCTTVVTSQSGLTERSAAKTAPHLLLQSQAGRSFIMH